jgi:hypothetical protein
VQQQRAHAHHAGFERRVDGHLAAPGPEVRGDEPERFGLGVTAGVIGRREHCVTGFGNDLASKRDDGTHGEIASGLGRKREPDCAAEKS